MRKKTFTTIEIIITITLIGMLMIPLAIMSTEYMQGIFYSRDLGIAQGLAKIEMAKVNNLAYSDVTLADGYDNTIANYEDYPYDLRRTVNYVTGWSNNLKQVQVRVFPAGNTTAHLVNLVSYVADIAYGAGSGGGVIGIGQADSLVVSGGTINKNQLKNVDLENTSADPITITKVLIEYSGSPGMKLKTITIDGVDKWSGSANSGDTVVFDSNFTLSGSTFYNNTAFFTFTKKKTVSSITRLIFIMEDGTDTVEYSW